MATAGDGADMAVDVLPEPVAKVPSGVRGLDEVTGGGFPRGRPTLVVGAAGCGKTLLGMQFLVQGAMEHGEPGVHLAFEETQQELAANVASLGYDLPRLQRERLLWLDHVRLDPAEIFETGEYDLEGLFVRIAAGVAAVGAKRIVLDTIEVLFGGLSDASVVRSELQRLFRWLKERGLTAIITGERGEAGRVSRFGIEEYVSDCVIVLDHRVSEDLSTRRLRVVKYRGSMHGTNEYPFLIGEAGLLVLPVTSLSLDHPAPVERVSSGIARLDELAGGGFYQGSSMLIGGSAGTGKTTFAAQFVDAACRRGERAVFVSYEESPRQLIRDMHSVGIDLQQWVDADRLRFQSTRPSLYGLEAHLASLMRLVNDFDPAVVVVDPISSMLHAGSSSEVVTMLIREVDFLKSRGLTAMFTTLTGMEHLEHSGVAVSSLIDTWLLTRAVETNGERTRVLYLIKSRGTSHSNQLAEFELTDNGIRILDPYIGAAGVLTGSARLSQEAADTALNLKRSQEVQSRQRELHRRREAVEAQVAALWRGYETDAEAVQQLVAEDQDRADRLRGLRQVMAQHRSAPDTRTDDDGRLPEQADRPEGRPR